MKIAMIGHKRIPSREGGVEIVVEELATRMAAQGHTVHVYNRAGKHVAGATHGGARIGKMYKGVRLVTVPTIPVKGLDALVYSFFATILALFRRYDIVHYHAEGPSAMIPLMRLFRKKTVSTVHGLDWQRSKWGGFAAKYLRFGERALARRADEVIVLSQNNAAYFQNTYGRTVTFIPNAVTAPAKRAPDHITRDFGLRGGDYILFLARLVPEKGLHYLLDAYRQIDTPVRLVVAGGASHSVDYVQTLQAQASLDPRVVMTGFVQGALLEELYSNCLLYVLPSDVEGMPLSLLEAMSYGRVCLVSDIPENLEAAQGYGASFRHGDTASLKESLEALLAGNRHMPPEEDIAAFVSETYNWARAVQAHLAVYERALARRRT